MFWKGLDSNCYLHPYLDKFTPCFCVFGCFLSETSRNFTDSMAMGIKHFEVVKRRSHADKQWSPDEIRVWQHANTHFLDIQLSQLLQGMLDVNRDKMNTSSLSIITHITSKFLTILGNPTTNSWWCYPISIQELTLPGTCIQVSGAPLILTSRTSCETNNDIFYYATSYLTTRTSSNIGTSLSCRDVNKAYSCEFLPKVAS